MCTVCSYARFWKNIGHNILHFTDCITHMCLLHSVGIIVNQSQYVCKVFLLCFVSDLPAKALVLNFIQFNGYWGCSQCLQKDYETYM